MPEKPSNSENKLKTGRLPSPLISSSDSQWVLHPSPSKAALQPLADSLIEHFQLGSNTQVWLMSLTFTGSSNGLAHLQSWQRA